LKRSFTLPALWALPVLVATIAVAYFAVSWLKSTGVVRGVWLAASIGGIFGVAGGLPRQLMFSNMKYVTWRKAAAASGDGGQA
jgi:hypothetical protein